MQTYAKIMEEPKEQLRRMIIDPTIDINEKLNLIYFVYRLGLTYLFVEEIDGQLDKLFNELDFTDYQEADLYTISVHFQVFRTHGYKLSCDVFDKFKDHNTGAFKEDIVADVMGMLTFFL
nr:putative terpenoid cyclases/protein prenyltransferase alpha-alpha toroid [Tanacetum cinerariifolium]GFB32120.1 putative terpenoid cyclases/protein prenyltransferase alpha-alpha toroid [Tanacetum cinerariifolium]